MGLLKKHGHQCYGIYQGVDTLLGEQPVAGFKKPVALDGLLSMRPDIVGFSACSFEIAEQLRMAFLVKEADPSVLVVFGGVHPTIMPESVIDNAAVDVVCIGEGEYPLLDLCNALESQQDISNIASLWVKRNGSVCKNAVRDYAQNLDELKMDREDLVYHGLFTGRGCVGNCTFCNTPTIRRMCGGGKFFRKRSIGRVLDEIVQICEDGLGRYNLRRLEKALGFMFVPGRVARNVVSGCASVVAKSLNLQNSLDGLWQWLSTTSPQPIRFKDDTFLADRKWFMEFAPAFKKRFPRLKYICQARADEITQEVARMLGESGCYLVSVGIECGNDEFRNRILKKHVTNANILRAIELLREQGIKIMGQWIIGYPGETVELAMESLLFHMQVGDIPQVHIATPFPKTEMHNRAVEMGLISEDYIPDRTIYDDFMFHAGHEKTVLRIIYELFPIASMPVDTDFKDIEHGERVERYRRGAKIGEILEWAILRKRDDF